MGAFRFLSPQKIVAEDGAAGQLGALVHGMGRRHALIVTDPFLATSGLLDGALTGLKAHGVAVTIFDAVQADPPEATVRAAADLARDSRVDAVVGIGGGSVMDTAKMAALLAVTGQPIEDLYGIDRATGRAWP